MKLSLILEVVSKGADRIGRMTRETRQLADRGMAPLERATNAATRAGERHDRQLSRVSASTFKWMRGTIRAADALDRATARAARFAGRAGLKAIELGATGAAKGIGLVVRKGLDFARAAAGWGALAAGAGAGWLVGGTIGLASDFEQFQVVLENTEGSAEKARKAMDWVKSFAKTTPYEVAQVMEAFVALKSYGIDPMSGSLMSLGNAASGMNKPLMQAIEMLADAQTGEFERLKEFGVRAKVTGDKVTFTYMKAGREISRTAKTSGTEINRAVLGIFDDRFSGMMDRQSHTLKGMWSNLQDMFANFQLDVADAGFFDTIKSKLQGVLDWINAKANDGTLKRWAENVSQWLTIAVEKLDQFLSNPETMKTMASQGMQIARAMWAVALAMAKIVELAGKVRTGIQWLNENRGSDLLGLTTPVAKPRVNPAPRVSADSWARALRSGPPALAPAAASTAGKGARPVDGKVKVEVELKGDGARGARTRVSSSSKQVPVSVWTGALRGQANGGPA